MVKTIKDVARFRSDRPWGAQEIAEIEGATVRLHWTDQPYFWHVDDGTEVFVVLEGEVEMRFRRGGRRPAYALRPLIFSLRTWGTNMSPIPWVRRASW